MREQPAVAVVALVLGFLIGLAAPGVAQVPPGPPLPAPPPEDLVQFQPPNEALLQDAQQYLQVGQEYGGFDLCRGVPASPAPGSTCGDPLNPSATVRGGNPPYHFQLDAMGGFPPLGMWVDLNGVLRGKPTGTLGANFRVCAVDMSGRPSCQEVKVPNPRPAPETQVSEKKKSGMNGTKLAVGLLGGLAVGGAAIYAGSAMSQLATTSASGECYSSRQCSPHIMSSGCECDGTLNAGCDWAGAVAGLNEACVSMPCRAGLSCNNGRCEDSHGRCPF